MQRGNMKPLPLWFFGLLVGVFGIKLALVSDLSVHVVFAPHDDSLYIARALFLLNDGDFGPYDSRTLAKLPGISIWLASLRALGLPYVMSMNVLYAGAGLYVLFALRRCGVHALILFFIWALYIFNPITMGFEWFRIMREPLSTILLTALFGAASHIFICARNGKQYWLHLLIFAITITFSMMVREEDKLLWGLLLMFVGAIFLDGLFRGESKKWSLLAAVPLLIVPTLTALACDFALRQAVENRYGMPILHDFGEGEFPKLTAAIRSIDVKKDNRLVMVTQEALAQVLRVEPGFAPIIDRIPPHGPQSFSCRLQGVCTEWSNGWMQFWMKDAAFSAGLTPDLISAQMYFGKVREQIEVACRNGQLKCTQRGRGFVPPFELRWTRAFVTELAPLLRMFLDPLPYGLKGTGLHPSANQELRQVAQSVILEGTSINIGNSLSAAYENFFSTVRAEMVKPYFAFSAIMLILSIGGFLYCWTAEHVHPPSILLWIVTVFFGYSLVRLLALTYVATFLGPFEPRIIFSTYTTALLFCPIVIVEAVRLYRLSISRSRVSVH